MGWKETLEGLYGSRDWKTATPEERTAAVTDIIQVSAFGSAAVSVTPVPLADIVIALPMQAAMVVAIGHIKGRNIGKEESFTIARELSTVVGTHMLAKKAFIALSRIIFPGMAGFLMAPWTFGITYAMGRVAELYFDDPNAPERVLKDKFTEALADARKVFSKEAFMDFMKRRGKDAQEYAQKEAPKEEAAKTPPASKPTPTEVTSPQAGKVVEADWEDAGGNGDKK